MGLALQETTYPSISLSVSNRNLVSSAHTTATCGRATAFAARKGTRQRRRSRGRLRAQAGAAGSSKKHTSISDGLKSIETMALSVEMATCAAHARQILQLIFCGARCHVHARRGIRARRNGHAAAGGGDRHTCAALTSIVSLRFHLGFFLTFFSSELLASTFFAPDAVA